MSADLKDPHLIKLTQPIGAGDRRDVYRCGDGGNHPGNVRPRGRDGRREASPGVWDRDAQPHAEGERLA